jgi:hypothetical protein
MIPNHLTRVLLKNLMSRQLIVKELDTFYDNPLVPITSYVNSIYGTVSYRFTIHNHDKHHQYL